jgi:ABC-type amino acid transport substrate-binding protein
LETAEPIKAQPFAIPVHRDDVALRDFMDNAILDLQVSGTIDRLLAKWEPEPNVFLRAAKPYR